MLEYQPKCRDFQRSIGRIDFCVRTDLLTDGILRERFAALVHNRRQLNQEILSQVGAMKTRLHQHLETISGLDGIRPMQ
jgi:polysaccharide pyruvyl transferase WcaK-like protein